MNIVKREGFNVQRISLLFFLLCLLLLHILVINLFPDSRIVLFLFILISGVFQYFVPVYQVISGREELFSPVIIFFFLFQFFYFIHPLQIIFYGPTLAATKGLVNTVVAVKMFYFINTAAISFYIGYHFLTKRNYESVKKHINRIPEFDRKIGVIISLGFIVTGFLFFLIIIQWNLVHFVKNLHIRALVWRGNGFYTLLSYLTPVGIFGFFYFSTINSEKVKKSTAFLTLVFLFIYMLEGSRGRVFIVLMAILLFYYFEIRKIKLKLILVFTLTVFVVFWIFAVFRESGSVNLSGGRGSTPLLLRMNTKMFYMTEHFTQTIVSPPPKKLYGRSYFDPITIIIPRLLWEDKPVTGIACFYSNYYFPGIKERGVTFGPGSIGTALLNFGYPGVIFDFIIIGFLLKLLYSKLLAGRRKPGYWILIIYISISTIVFITVSRSFITSISMLVFFLLPLFALILTVKSTLHFIRKWEIGGK